MTKQTKFIAAIALQVVIILVIVVLKLSVVASGSDIMLRIAPIDPRDPFRGDYITFQYSDISNLSQNLPGVAQVKTGDMIYVALQQQRGKYWGATSVRKTRSSGEPEIIFLKGKVVNGSRRDVAPGTMADPFFRETGIRVIYGIEEYFIPEGSGHNFDFRDKEAAAKVTVDESGSAVLRQIYVDGKPWP